MKTLNGVEVSAAWIISQLSGLFKATQLLFYLKQVVMCVL